MITESTPSTETFKYHSNLYCFLFFRNTMNSSNRGNRSGISTFIVNFHACLYAAFYIKPCKIYLRFGSDNLGGWKSVANEMHIVA